MSWTRSVDLRVRALPIEADARTRDGTAVTVELTCYFRIEDAETAVSTLEDVESAVADLATVTARSVVGDLPVGDLVGDHCAATEPLLEELDGATDDWGVTVDAVEADSVTAHFIHPED